jgi:hypothetical protein
MGASQPPDDDPVVRAIGDLERFKKAALAAYERALQIRAEQEEAKRQRDRERA